MSNPSLIHRSNANSSLYNTIKARNSKQDVFSYVNEGESNICPVARSKVIVNPTTSMASGGNQTIKFELPPFGLCEDMYLQTKFLQGGTNADGSNDVALVDFAGAFSFTRVRITYQNATLWEATPEALLCGLYTRADASKSVQLDTMLGSAPLGAAAAVGSLIGRRALASVNGGQVLTCPLKAWFTESLGRAWDLYSLSSRAYVEVDYRANADLHEVADSTKCLFDDCNLVCYMAELSPEELVRYQANNYAPNSVSSQIGYSTTLFSDSISSPVIITATSTAGNKVKIQSISGLVRRLFVFATLVTDRSSATAKSYMSTVDLAQVKLLANNQSIYELENCAVALDNLSVSAGNGFHTDGVLEAFRNNLPMGFRGNNSDNETTTTYSVPDVVTTGAGTTKGGKFSPAHVKVINFGYNPQDRASADGSLSLSQLGQPEIEVKFPTGTSGAHTLHVVAEILNIATYNVSSNGSINFKVITE